MDIKGLKRAGIIFSIMINSLCTKNFTIYQSWIFKSFSDATTTADANADITADAKMQD